MSESPSTFSEPSTTSFEDTMSTSSTEPTPDPSPTESDTVASTSESSTESTSSTSSTRTRSSTTRTRTGTQPTTSAGDDDGDDDEGASSAASSSTRGGTSSTPDSTSSFAPTSRPTGSNSSQTSARLRTEVVTVMSDGHAVTLTRIQTATAGDFDGVAASASGSRSARIGGIVGGVVGGLMVLLLGMLFTVWFLRRRRRRKDVETFDGNFDPARPTSRPISQLQHLGSTASFDPRRATLPPIEYTDQDEHDLTLPRSTKRESSGAGSSVLFAPSVRSAPSAFPNPFFDNVMRSPTVSSHNSLGRQSQHSSSQQHEDSSPDETGRLRGRMSPTGQQDYIRTGPVPRSPTQ